MNRSRRIPRIAALFLCAACSPSKDPPPVPTTRAAPAAAPQPVAGSQPALDPLPEAPSMAGAGVVPAVEVLVAAGECPALPALAKDAPAVRRELVPAIAVLREISCRPEVFGMATPQALQTLNVPAAVRLEIGHRYARVALPGAAAVSDVLAVMGVTGARIRLEQGWSSSWVVVAGDASELRPFGPGVFSLRIRGKRNDPTADGTLADIPPDALVDSLVVELPESAARFAADPYAAPAAVGALIAMASDTSLLGQEPEQAHARLAMLGERYSLYRFSVGLGPGSRVGFSLRPNRTELPANELAEGLALAGAHHQRIHITDANDSRLAHEGRTEIPWHGLELEIELDERTEGGAGLAGWLVAEIQILPAPKP